MNPRVTDVEPAQDYHLLVTFENGEKRLFDVRPYLDRGVFRDLCNEVAFAQVRAHLGTVVWQGGQDLCPDTLYEQGQAV